MNKRITLEPQEIEFLAELTKQQLNHANTDSQRGVLTKHALNRLLQKLGVGSNE